MVMAELPQWYSHKKVRAAKIERVDLAATSEPTLLYLEGDFEISVTDEWIGRHTPKGGILIDLVGGYFVRYIDGYESWSPAKAFEDGYTLGPDIHAEGACPPDVGEEDPSIVEAAPPFEG